MEYVMNLNNSLTFLHPGVNTTQKILEKLNIVIPKNIITEINIQFAVCQMGKDRNCKKPGPFLPFGVPANPYDTIHIDIAGPIENSCYNHILVILGRFWRYIWAYPHIEMLSSSSIIKILYESRKDRVKDIKTAITDQGAQFFLS
jgi:hypothetical protein